MINRVVLPLVDVWELETKCVDQVVSEGGLGRYMFDVMGEVAATVVYHMDLPVSWNGKDSEPGMDAEERGDAEGVDWITSCVIVLVGDGDNGGDTLYAYATLVRKGIGATAYLLKKRRHRHAFTAAQEAGMRTTDLGGQSLRSIENTPAWSDALLAHAQIDGVVDTGSHGPPTGAPVESVELLNRLSAIKPRPVTVIDIPSSLTDDDGTIAGPILRATHILTVGTYKRTQVLSLAVEFTRGISLVTMDRDSSGTNCT